MGVKLTKHVVHQCKRNQLPTTVGKPTLYPFKLDARSAAKFTIKRPIGSEEDEFVKHLDEVTIEQDWFYLSCEDGDAVYRENSGPDLDAHFVQDPLGVLIIHSCTKESNRGKNKFERKIRYAKNQIKKSMLRRVKNPRLGKKIIDEQHAFLKKTTDLTMQTIAERERDFTKHLRSHYDNITKKYSPDQKRFVDNISMNFKATPTKPKVVAADGDENVQMSELDMAQFMNDCAADEALVKTEVWADISLQQYKQKLEENRALMTSVYYCFIINRLFYCKDYGRNLEEIN